MKSTGKNRRKRRYSKKKGGAQQNEHYVFKFTPTSGFGSMANFFVPAYSLAKKTRRPFFIDDSEWHYGNWHDYFKSLSRLDTSAKRNGIEYTHGSKIRPSSVKEYKDAIKDIYILNDDLLKSANEYKEGIGGPYKSLYVRRGDKTTGNRKENDSIDLAELLKTTDIRDGDNLFVMTDDYRVIEELRTLIPDVKISTLTPSNSRGADSIKLEGETKEKIKENGNELFTSIQVLLGGTKGWVDNRSNLGRFMKLASPDTMILYPSEAEHVKMNANTMVIDPGLGPLRIRG